MNPCSNCGKVNAGESNFCRFCGTKFTFQQTARDNPYDYAAPRPYVWKTDEFQTQNEARRTASVDRPPVVNAPIASFGPPQYQPQHLAYQPSPQLSPYFHCPHCASQLEPRVERRISTAGWITFAVLLVFFFPLFWIGLLIKEDARVCWTCNNRIG